MKYSETDTTHVNSTATHCVTQTFLGGGKCSTGTVDTSSLNMPPSALAQLPDMKEKTSHTRKKRPDTLQTQTPLDGGS